jgi:branched-chain amino acid transport system ATP-binding protein
MVEQNVQMSLPIASRALVVKTGRVVYVGGVAPLKDHVELMTLF